MQKDFLTPAQTLRHSPSLLALGPFERTTKSRKSHGALTVLINLRTEMVAVHCRLSAMRHAPGSTPGGEMHPGIVT